MFGRKKQPKCVFCDVNKIESKVRSIGSSCIYFEPLNPVVKGHLLVVNKTHSKDFTDKSMLFAETAKAAADLAKKLGGSYNLITSKGKEATQSVFHCHIHLIPRKKGDGLLLPWSNQKS